jgi:hypothetical protein
MRLGRPYVDMYGGAQKIRLRFATQESYNPLSGSNQTSYELGLGRPSSVSLACLKLPSPIASPQLVS